VPDQEVDQRGLGERGCAKRLLAHKLNREDAMEEADKG